MKIHDQQRLILILFSNILLWMIVVSTICWGAELVFPMERTTIESDSARRIHTTSRAVEHAWEEFHRSAIGGTLASPMIQTQIEQQLHEARGLLMEARKAQRKGDHHSVLTITGRVIHLSKTIIASSRERKP
ncbi:MAG: hypothetical protein NPIRA02_39520 [Nitrospirales bacterium]|nr:MAG: hypothetical protein NPIRA02_39520 [Nitrospirales bacterium]